MSVAMLNVGFSRKFVTQRAGAAFSLYVQPIRPLQNAASFSWGEVLLRSREGGRINAPGPVLRHAAKLGLAMELDLLIIAETARTLHCCDIDLLSVNVSGQSVSHPEFYQLVSAVLSDANVGFEHFCFEITETEPVHDMHAARGFCQQARNAGALIALDDFGTGYSSMELCTQRCVDVLKIPQTLVEALRHGRKEMAIIDGLVALSENLGLVTIVEGIETVALLPLVRDAGVDFVQGYVNQGEAVPIVRFSREQRRRCA